MSSFTPHTTFRLRHLTVFWAVPFVGDLMISGLDHLQRSQTIKELCLSLFGPPEWNSPALKQLPNQD